MGFCGIRKKQQQMMNLQSQVPKGCLAVKVGQGDEEEMRFFVPVLYINHPLFMKLLKCAEEEYGFDHKGPIAIPCHVEDFLSVQRLIGLDQKQQQHHNRFLCFGH